ncbi:TPA: hypothetical protein ACXPNF_000967, partial [Salmonella enterica]
NSLIPNLLLHPSTTDNTPKTSSPIRKKQYRCLNIYLHIKIASGIWHLASGIWHLAVRLQAYWYSNQLLDSSGLQNKQKTLSTITPKKR